MDVTCSKSTYQYVTDNPTSIIHRHIKYMKEINLVVPSNMENYLVSIGCPSCIKLLLAQGLLLPRIGVQRNLILRKKHTSSREHYIANPEEKTCML